MPLQFLDFEQPIAELEAKIEELRFLGDDSELNIAEEIEKLRAKSRTLTTSIFGSLTPWQITQLARHPQRPYTLDYIPLLFTEFQELHGDRMYADDQAIVGGLARLSGTPVLVIGQQKGRDTKERVRRNYGMPKPEGYRKARRLMLTAERFGLPVVTLIDTPGAYPGVGSEERNQSEAIARNLFEMATLGVPIVSCVIGEGGSGGALAIGVCDRLLMLQYSVYSVISPEGCASILWKSADRRELAAEAMAITAERLARLNLVDEVIPEPLGGAHREPQAMAESLRLGADAPARGTHGTAARSSCCPAGSVACAISGSTAEPDMDFGAPRLAAALARLDPSGSATGFCVALSGGLDSSVLLHAMAALRDAPNARALRAVHVDHGLQPESAAWAESCRALCRRLDVPIEVATLSLSLPPGASVEAEARDARYAATGGAAASGRVAADRASSRRPARDRADPAVARRGCRRPRGDAGTRASRRGLARAALARARPCGDRRLRRAARARLGARPHERFDAFRPRVAARRTCCPRSGQRWPAASATVARSASHLAEARRLLDELAQAGCRRARGRRAARHRRPAAPFARSGRPTCCAGGSVRAAWARRRRRALRRRCANCLAPAPMRRRWCAGRTANCGVTAAACMPCIRCRRRPCRRRARMRGQGLSTSARGSGKFSLVAGVQGGLRLPLTGEPVIRFRAGGEGLRTHRDRPRKRLKDLCREAGIVPWMRERLPLVFVGEQLAAVGDLWIEAGAGGAGGRAGTPAGLERPAGTPLAHQRQHSAVLSPPPSSAAVRIPRSVTRERAARVVLELVLACHRVAETVKPVAGSGASIASVVPAILAVGGALHFARRRSPVALAMSVA